jgi:TPR repeat protein
MFQNIFAFVFKQHKRQGRNRLTLACVIGLLLVLFSFSICAEEGHKLETRPAASLWYRELAAQGDVDAKYNLGMMNETGWSIPVDLKGAVQWYRDAAKQGHVEAQLRLGMLYYLGLGAKRSKLKGESWIRKAAKHDHKFAQSLNKILFTEDAPDTLDQKRVLRKVRKIYLQDEKKAISRLQQLVAAAQRKSTGQQQVKEKTTIRERREAREEVGQSGVTKEMSEEKKKELERIESVVPEFIVKKSVEENRTLVRGNIATIRLQAKKGQASAQYNLGRMYELEIKVPVDKAKALAWYKKSADQGYADAQYRLAISMLYGNSAERNERSGRKWLSLAANNGHQTAQNLLANMANLEDFGAGNSLALTWYLDRAIAGNAEAALSLGKIFEHGWGISSDLHEATKWYKRAQMLGAKDAEVLLRDLKTHIAQNNGTAGEIGGATGNFRPPDWAAYLMAIVLAIGIIFWPLFKRSKGKQKKVKRSKGKLSKATRKKIKRSRPTGISVDAKNVTEEKSPFG